MSKSILKKENNFKKANNGFTIIELLVVVGVIGILVVLIIYNLVSTRIKGRDSKRKADLRSIRTALEQYVDNNSGNYPNNLNDLVPDYISIIPTDPRTSAAYPYAVSGTGTEYEINAILENADDLDDDNDGGNAAGTYEVGNDPNLDLI